MHAGRPPHRSVREELPHTALAASEAFEDKITVTKFRPVIAVSDMMRLIKTSSSKWVNDHQKVRGGFSWQSGYAVFSVRSQRNDVSNQRQIEPSRNAASVFIRNAAAVFSRKKRPPFSAATRQAFSAATRRQDVAMGVSPWPSDSIKRSPDGTTGSVASGPSGLHACVHGNHGLKPVATTYRPFGTSIRRPLGTNVLGFPLPSRGNR